MIWQLSARTVSLDRPFIMGIVNVTPDSFSDGGSLPDADAAVRHAERLLDTGADCIDVGGQSTRPGNAGQVTVEVELARVLPVVGALRLTRPNAVISIDTVRAEVAQAALDAGADVVNDVSGLRLDPQMGRVCAAARAGVVIMHSRGGVADMATYAHAHYDADPIGEIVRELGECVDAARSAGVAAARIVVDPGIGFSKRTETSIATLRDLPRLASLGRPVMVGASRKRFVGELSGVSEPVARVHGSIGAHVAALARGARLFRVHDVRAHREALDVAWAVLREHDAPTTALAREARALGPLGGEQ